MAWGRRPRRRWRRRPVRGTDGAGRSWSTIRDRRGIPRARGGRGSWGTGRRGPAIGFALSGGGAVARCCWRRPIHGGLGKEILRFAQDDDPRSDRLGHHWPGEDFSVGGDGLVGDGLLGVEGLDAPEALFAQ